MTITITLTANPFTGAGVNYNAEYLSYFADFTPYELPLFLGPSSSNTTQIVHLDTPVTGQEAQTKALLVEGSGFLYTFSDHVVSGTINTIRLTTLGSALNPSTGDLVLNGGVVTTATESIAISGLNLSNAAHVRGDVHNLIAGFMGGGPGGTTADPSLLTTVIWSQGHNLRGSTGADTYWGSDYSDIVRGFGGNDSLHGGLGNDRVVGGGGRDVVSGGAGKDILEGGNGADDFLYFYASDSTAAVAGRDRILDFVSGVDDIDLRYIDADNRDVDNDAFIWRDKLAFDGTAGALHWRATSVGVLLEADLNGDRVADFAIYLDGISSLARGDIML